MKIYRYGCDSCEEVYTSITEQLAIDAADECCAVLNDFSGYWQPELTEVDCD